MFNFASLFNQFRTQSNSGLNEMLQQPNLSVGCLLDLDSFIGEFKSGNPRVMEFMKYDKYKELVDYVTVVGPAQDKKRSYKYPFTACEILSLDHNTIIEYFFPENTLTIEQTTVEQVEVEEEVEVDDQPESTQPSAEPTDPISEDPSMPDSPEKELDAQTDKPSTESKQQEKAEEVMQEEKPAEEKKSEDEATECPASSQEAKPEEAGGESEQKQGEISYPVLDEPAPKKVKTELRKVKRHNEVTVSKEVEPLIGQLMSYFRGEINYTLAGYVCKILTAFFNKKPAEFMTYILKEENSRAVLDHCESRSAGELIIKVLTHESTLSLAERTAFFKMVLDLLSLPSQIYVMSNVSSYICEVIEKIAANLKGSNKLPELQEAFFSLEVITQVIKNVMSADEHVSIYNAPILFAYLTNVPFVLPQDPQIIEDFKTLLQDFVDKSVEKLQVSSRERPKLGTGRVNIVQIIRFILKENILNSRQIVAKNQNFFPTLIKLVREYQWNNLLHNEIVRILQIALTESEGSLINAAVLKDGIISKFIQEQTQEDQRIKAGDSVYKSRKGYIAHVTNLAMKMRELAENNSKIKEIVEGYDFSDVYESFVEKEVFKTRKTLAGYSMRKDIKHEIVFQKEDIIATYATFLQKCPSPVFESEPESVSSEHHDLIEELQKQLNDMSAKPKEEDQSEQARTGIAEEQAAIRQVLPANYWQLHIDYDLNDLMADL